jgi:hypothetical protein
MNLGTQFKRLNKLAKAAGVSARCAYCRFALRETFGTGGTVKRDPDKILVTCEWCGTQYNRTLPADPVERAIRLEIAHDTTAEAYSTHRKRALHIWVGYHARARASQPKPKQAPSRRNSVSLTPAQKKRKEMFDAYAKLVSDTNRRARRAAPKFPDLDEILIALLPGHYSSDETSEHLRQLYFEHRTKQLDALAKLETIIFGEPQAATLEASAAVAEQAAEFSRAKVEKAEREAAERAEQEKRRREANERRMSPAVVQPQEQPATLPKPVEEGDFWSDPTRVYENRGDSMASMVAVALDVGSDSPADPTRGLVLRSGDASPAQQSPPRFRTNRPAGRPYRLNGTPKR